MKVERNAYFDFLRGLAILMVVAIHCFPASDFESFGGQLNILLRQLLNTAVPIFLAISGFFLSGKVLNTASDCVTFWKKQLPRVYVPVLIWSFPLFVASLLSDVKYGGGGNCQTVLVRI